MSRGSRRVTLNDVAVQAGLSITQVSRALAGYHDVAETTRLRVQQLARELGYQPSLRARALKLGRQAVLRCAVVTLDLPARWLQRSSYGPALAGILAGAGAERMDLHLTALANSSPDDAQSVADELARFAAADRADGIVLLTFLPLRPEHVAPLDDAGMPYILVNRHFEYVPDAPAVDCVTADWAGASRAAVERLHGLGHRRMVAFLPASDTSTTQDRIHGWHAGVAACGIDPADAPILSDDYRGPRRLETLGRQLSHRVLVAGLPETGRPPTAIVSYNETMANGILRTAGELGVQVPAELSVIGVDNIVGGHFTPPLCTYDPNFYRMGEVAASRLAGRMRGDAAHTGEPARVTLPVEFVCRKTCGPA
jgi:LacI family transcriptional regulator